MIEYATPADDPGCREQIAEAVFRLYRRASSILGDQCEATPDYTTTYLHGLLSETLTGDDVDTAALATMAAYQIVKDLVDPGEVAEPGWWGTPLGRAVCWWVGWPGNPKASVQIVPASVVRHVLGFTRQAAFQRGDIYSDELQRALRERWPAMQRRKPASPAALTLVKAFGVDA